MNRNRVIFFIFLSLLTINLTNAQLHTKKPVKSKKQLKKEARKEKREESLTNFQIGGGIMGSVLYLSRNVKEDNDALGYTISANYGGHKLLRLSAQYTNYFPINIEPTWYTIRANTFEANIEIMARFKDNKTFLYPFAGISYNTFKGYFTGVNDYLNLREKYKANSKVNSYWTGLNIGTGLEHTFGTYFVLFADYRMRIGSGGERGGFNIMDVCYSGGLRIKLWVPTVHKLFRGLHDKYHWF